MLDFCRQHGFDPEPVQDHDKIPLTLADSDSGSDFSLLHPSPAAWTPYGPCFTILYFAVLSCFGYKRNKNAKPYLTSEELARGRGHVWFGWVCYTPNPTLASVSFNLSLLLFFLIFYFFSVKKSTYSKHTDWVSVLLGDVSVELSCPISPPSLITIIVSVLSLLSGVLDSPVFPFFLLHTVAGSLLPNKRVLWVTPCSLQFSPSFTMGRWLSLAGRPRVATRLVALANRCWKCCGNRG